MERVRPQRPPPPNLSTANYSPEYSQIKEYYFTSMCYVRNGLDADERGNIPDSMKHYLNALQCIEKGLEVQLPVGASESEQNRANSMTVKMVQALDSVQTRLYALQGINSGPSVPTYSEELPAGHHSSLIGVGDENSSSNSNVPIEDAAELLNIPNGVQLFCVSSNNEVAPPSYPGSLQIVLLDSTTADAPPAFIKVGEWVYPLVPGQSPILRCHNGAYVFPNISVSHSGLQPDSVGIVISSSLDPTYREMFENILENYAVLHIQELSPEGEPDLNLSDMVAEVEPSAPDEEKEGTKETASVKIVHGIEKGAEWITWGLSKGAEFTSSLIQKGANKLQNNIKPDEKEAEISPGVQKGLYYTHEATKVTVKVSAAMIKGLCLVTKEVAKAVTPHIKSYTDSLLPKSAVEKDSSGVSKVDEALHVAGAGITGFVTVWSSLEKSGFAIAKSMSDATVDTVQHKYGSAAGKATSHGMYSALNAGKTVFNLDNLGLKAIAKQTAKDTGKTFLASYARDGEKIKVPKDDIVNGEASTSQNKQIVRKS